MALINVMEVDNGKVIAAGGTGGGEGGKDYVPGYNIDITGDTIKSKDFVGTQDEWDALTAAQKAKFDQINITDDFDEPSEHPGHAILNTSGTLMPQRSNLKASGFTVTDDSTNDTTVITEIPYTAGRGIDITSKEVSLDSSVVTTFTGTKAEWGTLTDDQKAEYTIVNLTDDVAGGEITVVDVVESNNMNPVTSNAVADHLVDQLGGTSDTFKFATDGNGNYGYVKKVAGADTFVPFKSGSSAAWIKLGGTHNTGYTYEDSTGVSISQTGETAFTTAVNSSGGLMYDLNMVYDYGIFNYKIKFDGVHVVYQQYAMNIQTFTKDTTISPYSTGQALNTMAYGLGDIFIEQS